jgi:hypothetical protein
VPFKILWPRKETQKVEIGQVGERLRDYAGVRSKKSTVPAVTGIMFSTETVASVAKDAQVLGRR